MTSVPGPEPQDVGSRRIRGRRKTLSGGLWNASSTTIPLLTTALLSITISRVLGASSLGLQSLIAYAQALLFTVVVVSLTSAAIQSISEAHGSGLPEVEDQIDRWSRIAHVTVGVGCAAVLVLIGALSDEGLPWFIAAAVTVVDAVGWSYACRTIANAGWGPIGARRLAAQLSAQTMAIAAVLAGFGIAGIFFASLIASLVLAWSLRRLRGPVRQVRRTDQLHPPFRLWGMFALTAVVTQVVGQRIEFLFLAAFSTTQQIAMYSVAFMVVSAVTLTAWSTFQAAMPSVAAASGAGRRVELMNQVGPAVRVTAIVSLPVTAILVSSGPSVVRLLYGSEFQEAANLVPIMAVVVVFAPLASLLTALWSGLAGLRHPLVAGALGGVVDLTAAFILVPIFTAVGAAVANVSGQMVAALILLVQTRRHLTTFHWGARRWVLVATIATIAGLGGLTVSTVLGGIAGLVVGAGLVTLLLSVFGRLVGFLDSADADWLERSVPRSLEPIVRVLCGRRWTGRPAH